MSEEQKKPELKVVDGGAEKADEAQAPSLKMPAETVDISEMQVSGQVLDHLSNVRADDFVKAIFEEKFTRAEENYKRFQLTQAALSITNQRIQRALMRAEKARQGDAAMMASLQEAAKAAAAEGITATSPAEAEAQNAAAKAEAAATDGKDGATA